MARRILTPIEVDRLNSCDDRLGRVIRRGIELGLPIRVLEGHRGEVAQNVLYAEKKTQKKWPYGEHNKYPSLAVDIAPEPIMYPTVNDSRYVYGKKIGRFYYLVGKIIMLAWVEFKIELRPGADWDQDGEIMDQEFDDLGHIEIAR